jgi:transporter family protein
MKPCIFALCTAIAWGVGGYLEKKGLHQGNLSPQTLKSVAGLVLTVGGIVLLTAG